MTIPSSLLTAISGSRALDAEIARAFVPRVWAAARLLASMPHGAPEHVIDEQAPRFLPRWSISLDAAAALVEELLPAEQWVVRRFGPQSYAAVVRGPGAEAPTAPLALLKALFAARGERGAGGDG